MFSFTLPRFVSACSVLASLSGVLSAPLTSSLVARSAPPSPAFVVYSDAFVSANVLPDPSQVKGFNVMALAFLLSSKPFDQAAAWAALPADQRATIKSQYSSAGISIIVSAFGSTEEPTTQGVDPTSTANTMAQFVLNNGLDGIDVDYEDLDAMNAKNGAAEAWLTTFTQTLRTQLPKGQFILTHAPLAPWFSTAYPQAYHTVDKNVGSLIDWYNIQFYDQGATEYTDCNGLLTTSGGQFPSSSVFEIANQGIPLSRLVIGKLGSTADGSSGFMDPQTLGTCVAQAKSQGWSAGVMAFQFPHADTNWITAARGSTFPIA
ncbi:Endochitinase 3 [Grifola frondosa]|uniref:Endochitinase 3 n=2 Tax=Grifola frondosa TaxID=5627 RepID=A0A1C7MD50_GRIFR|nr:Endochitinase 3 [Grifola frondosa]